MLRSSVMALAALLPAVVLAPAQALAGEYFGSGWYGSWDFYGGRFLVATPTHIHEYAAYNLNCAFLRRLLATPLGPQCTGLRLKTRPLAAPYLPRRSRCSYVAVWHPPAC
jgi:hypothetical protein